VDFDTGGVVLGEGFPLAGVPPGDCFGDPEDGGTAGPDLGVVGA